MYSFTYVLMYSCIYVLMYSCTHVLIFSYTHVPHRYTQPPASAPSRQDLVMDCDIQTFPFHKHDILKVPLVRRLENIEISSQLAARLLPLELRPGLAVATVSGM